MFQLPFSRQEPQKSLGVDVGSTAVKILEPEESSYSSAYLDKYSTFDTASYTQDLIMKSLDKAWDRLDLKKEFGHILLSLPPQFFKSRTKSFGIEREQEDKISQKEKKNLIQKAKKKIKREISAELGFLEKDLYFKSWDLIGTKINGYSVSEPKGYNGREVEMRFLVTFLLNDFLKLRDVIGDYFQSEVELVHPAQGIIKNKERLSDGVYLDVGGETTQLFLVKNHGLRFTGEVKVGGRSFSRILEEELGLSELRSKVLKERYSREELSEGTTQTLREIMRKGRGLWAREVKKLLQEQPLQSLPPLFCLFGGGSKLSDVQLALKQERRWARSDSPSFARRATIGENSAFLDSPQIKFLTPQNLGFNFLDVQYTPLTLIVGNHKDLQ